MPLYEDTDMALFDTHYYGGIKKYQDGITLAGFHFTESSVKRMAAQ